VVYTDFTKEPQRRKFNEASALLKQYRHKIIDKCDKLDVEMHVLEGKHLQEDLVDFVDTNQADTLVIGSRGLNGMKRY
jgi:nucleotide-binding universal stress UspA family protein